MVRGLWDRQVDSIIDVKLCDADADSYKYEPMIALLSRWETIKKDKHGKQFHEQRKQFSPFVLSFDRMLRREALIVLSQLSRAMAKKREEPLSQVQGWVNRRIVIAVARSYSQIPLSSTPQFSAVYNTARRNQGSTGFWREKQGFQRKKQGLDGKPIRREAP